MGCASQSPTLLGSGDLDPGAASCSAALSILLSPVAPPESCPLLAQYRPEHPGPGLTEAHGQATRHIPLIKGRPLDCGFLPPAKPEETQQGCGGGVLRGAGGAPEGLPRPGLRWQAQLSATRRTLQESHQDRGASLGGERGGTTPTWGAEHLKQGPRGVGQQVRLRHSRLAPATQTAWSRAGPQAPAPRWPVLAHPGSWEPPAGAATS